MDTDASNNIQFGHQREGRVANSVGRSYKTKKGGRSNSDVRKLQKQVFDLSKENELLKELLDRIQRGSIPKRSTNQCCVGDAKIEEMLQDLKLEEKQQKDAPQIVPLSDCDDDTSNEYLPRNVDVSDRSGDSLALRNPNDMVSNNITEQQKQPERKQKKYNYCTADGEGPIDYFQLYS